MILLVCQLIWKHRSFKSTQLSPTGIWHFSTYPNTLCLSSMFCNFIQFPNLFVTVQEQSISHQGYLDVFGLLFPEVSGVFLFSSPLFQMVPCCILESFSFCVFILYSTVYLNYFVSKCISANFPGSSLIHLYPPRRENFLVQKTPIFLFFSVCFFSKYVSYFYHVK